MPVLRMKCECGHEYDALKSFSTADPSCENCPKCGSEKIESQATHGQGFALHSDLRDRRPEDYTPEEVSMMLENKASIEADSEKVLDGRMTLRERGPDWARPKVPDHLRKYSR